MQGIPTSVIKELPPGKAVKASGNAFPVPLIVAVFAPLLRAVIGKLGDLANWPSQVQSYTANELAAFKKALLALTPQVKKRSKNADAKMGMKQRRRKRKRLAEDEYIF